MKSGIYKITINDTFYYGQSQDLKKREQHHENDLRNVRHRNPHLQNAYSKYNEFTFEVVLVCEVNDLNRYEQWFLDQYQPMEKCANVATCAEASRRGLTVTHSPCAKTKMKIAWARRRGWDQPPVVPKRPAKGKQADSWARTGITQTSGVVYVVTMEAGEIAYRTLNQVAQAFGVDRSTPQRWAKGKPILPKHGIISFEPRQLTLS